MILISLIVVKSHITPRSSLSISIIETVDKRKIMPWLCGICSENLDREESVGCECCLK